MRACVCDGWLWIVCVRNIISATAAIAGYACVLACTQTLNTNVLPPIYSNSRLLCLWAAHLIVSLLFDIYLNTNTLEMTERWIFFRLQSSSLVMLLLVCYFECAQLFKRVFNKDRGRERESKQNIKEWLIFENKTSLNTATTFMSRKSICISIIIKNNKNTVWKTKWMANESFYSNITLHVVEYTHSLTHTHTHSARK